MILNNKQAGKVVTQPKFTRKKNYGKLKTPMQDILHELAVKPRPNNQKHNHFSNILNTAPDTHSTISSPSKRCTSQAQKHIKWRTYTFLLDRLNNDRISWQRLKLAILELRHTLPHTQNSAAVLRDHG